jgi:hypothetical protein
MFRGLRKAANRESKHYRRTKGMQVDNKSIFIIEKKIKDKAKAIQIEKEREEKESILNEELNENPTG